MRNILFAIALFIGASFASCGNKAAQAASDADSVLVDSDSITVDSFTVDSAEVDSVK